MLIDLTLGYNEIDMFRIRYHELHSVVDKFIIIEGTHTHSGREKPLYFSDWSQQEVLRHPTDKDIDWSKIDVYVWDNSGFPNDNAGAWAREHTHREMFMQATQTLRKTDYAMLSDMDEIPSKAAVQFALQNVVAARSPGVWRFEQTLSYLYLNTVAGPWCGTKLFPLILPRISDSPMPITEEIRYRPDDKIAGTIANGGWHFSSCGGLERVRLKFDSYAHTEMQLKTNEDIADSLQRIVDPFDKRPLTVTDVATLPQFVQENITFFKDAGYIYEHAM